MWEQGKNLPSTLSLASERTLIRQFLDLLRQFLRLTFEQRPALPQDETVRVFHDCAMEGTAPSVP